MAIQLVEKERPDNRDFEPVDMGNGVMLEFFKRTVDGKTIVRGSVKLEGKEVGYCSWNEEYKRLTMNVELNDRFDGRNVANEIYTTVMQIVDSE